MTQDLITIIPSLFDDGWDDIELDRFFRTGLDNISRHWMSEINPRGRLAWNAFKALQKRDDVVVVVYARNINTLFVVFDIHHKAGHVEYYVKHSRTLLITAVEEAIIDTVASDFEEIQSASIWRRATS